MAAAPAVVSTPANRVADRFAPLDAQHQEAFVLSVRDIARAVIFLAFGVVLGVALAWINGLTGKKKA